MVRLIILFLLLSFSSYGQTVQEAFSGYGDIQSITGSGPTYTITLNPFIGNPKFQPNGQYNGTDVSIGNVIWADCARYVIASVVSTSYSSMTVTATVPATDWALGITPPNPNQRVAIVTEIDGIPILPPTADGNGGALSSIDNILYACILAHQTKQLLIGKNSVNEITDYVGTTDVPPSPPASSYTGETWRNSVGEFYYSNGTQWLSDKEVKLTNTSLQGLSTGQYKIGIDTLGKDTMYLANNGIFRRFEAGGSNISFQLTTPPLGDLEITDGGGTLSVPILDIAPIQSVTGSNEISVSPSPGGTLSLDMPSQGASTHDIFRWDGSAWKPFKFVPKYPLLGNGIIGDSIRLDNGTAVNDVLMWDGSYWTPTQPFVVTDYPLIGAGTTLDPLKIDDGISTGNTLMWDGLDWSIQDLTTDATLAGNGWLSTPLKLAQNGATSGQVLKWNGTAWLPSNSTSGTVTSVGLAMPSIFSVTNSPVTSTGTLTASLVTQSANTVFAAPTGSSGIPTFRVPTHTDITNWGGIGITSGTIGQYQIPYGAGSGNYLNSSSTFVYNGSSLGIGTATPTSGIKIHTLGGSEQYWFLQSSSNGYSGIRFKNGTGTQNHIFFNNAGMSGDGTFVLTSGGSGGGLRKKLAVSGGVSIGAAYVNTDMNIDNSLIVQGNVGFGTISPLTTLHVSGNSPLIVDVSGYSDNIIFQSTAPAANSGFGIRFQDSQGAGSFARRLYFQKNCFNFGGTGAGYATDGNKLAHFNGSVTIGTGTGYISPTQVSNTNGLTVDGNTSMGTASPSTNSKLLINGSTSTSASFSFQAHNSTGTSNSLVVRDDKMVGIGRVPSYNLDVAVPQYGFANFETSTAGYGGIRIADGTQPILQFTSGANQQQLTGGLNFYFRNYATGGAVSFLTESNHRLWINANGNIGIGHTSPTALFHLKAGTAAVNTPPIKFTVTGAVLNTTPEVGALEVDAANRIYYVGASGTRNTIAYLSDVAATVSMKEESFTATAAQTTFTIAYSAPAPSGTSMPIRVYRNGVRLKYVSSGPTSTQFTYTTTTVTTTANAVGDIITIEYLN